jgi:hypothetical protein
VTDDDEPVPTCVVCGLATTGAPHVSLALFFVSLPDGSGMWFEPSESPADCESWQDATFGRDVHIGCVTNYFDGVLTEAEIYLRRE